MMENILSQFSEHVKTFSDLAVNFRKIFVTQLFGLALKQVSLSLNTTNRHSLRVRVEYYLIYNIGRLWEVM